MFRKTRLVVAAALVTALGTSAMAFAAGADTNEAFVDGSVSPSKLDKKKYKPVNLFTGVRTTVPGGVNGTQSNPVSEYLSYPKNVKFDLGAADICTTLPASGSTAQQARDACPKRSYLGSGVGEVQGPGIAPITDIVVSVFRGPGKNGVQLHTASGTLGPAAPTVLGEIVKSKVSGYGNALSVAHAPETGGLMITKFNAKITKASKAVTARCKSKSMKFQREVTYADGSKETVETTQKCKRKSKK